MEYESLKSLALSFSLILICDIPLRKRKRKEIFTGVGIQHLSYWLARLAINIKYYMLKYYMQGTELGSIDTLVNKSPCLYEFTMDNTDFSLSILTCKNIVTLKEKEKEQ